MDLSLSMLLMLFMEGILQRSISCASGVFSIPLLLLARLGLPETVGIHLICSIVENGLGVYQLRRHIRLRETTLPVLLRYASLGVGIWALWQVWKC